MKVQKKLFTPTAPVNVLRLKKPSTSAQNFDDGYFIEFPTSQPKHIQFYCMTDTGSKESCDVRLYLRGHGSEEKLQEFRTTTFRKLQAVDEEEKPKEVVSKEAKKEEKKEESDDEEEEDPEQMKQIHYQLNETSPGVLNCKKDKFTKDENANSLKRIMTPVFFRYGFYGQMKINTNNFIEKAFSADQWYKIDILIEWAKDKRKVALFVDNQEMLKAPLSKPEDFYSKDRDKDLECHMDEKKPEDKWDGVGVNTFMMYSLSPGTTSFFRNIRVCEDLCDDELLPGEEFKEEKETKQNEKCEPLEYPKFEGGRLNYSSTMYEKVFKQAVMIDLSVAGLVLALATMF